MKTLYKYDITVTTSSNKVIVTKYNIQENTEIVDINGSLSYIKDLNLDKLVCTNSDSFSITCKYYTLEEDKNKIISKIKNEILNFINERNKNLNQQIMNNVKMTLELFLVSL